MKVQLVLPKIVKGYEIGFNGILPPLGLIAIATYLKKNIRNIDVEVLDGDILPWKELKSRLSGDVIGINTNFGNYLNAVKIANIAKKKGAKIIFGGPYSAALPEIILKKHKSIDFIVRGDGEKALLSLVQGKPPELIKNIVFRNEKGDIIMNDIEELDLNKLPSPDFNFLDLKPYFHNFSTCLKTEDKELPVYSGKGCFWRSIRGCLFCAIPDKTSRMKNPKKVWDEISDARKKGATIIWITMDDFTSNINWIREFWKIRPKDSPALGIYSRANNISNEIAKMLSDLRCKTVFIGVESGNEKCLKALNKGVTLKQIISAVGILAKYGIEVNPSFILGAPGETKKSVEDTIRLIRKLVRFKNIITIEASILNPIPGSPAYTLLRNKLKDKYKNKDFVHTSLLQKEWVKTFCNVDFDYLVTALQKIKKLSRISFVVPKSAYK